MARRRGLGGRPAGPARHARSGTVPTPAGPRGPRTGPTGTAGVTEPAGTIEAMTRVLAAFDAVTERLMLPLTVLGLVGGLARHRRGQRRAGVVVLDGARRAGGAVARHLDRPRPAQGPGRRRRDRGHGDRRGPAAGRVADGIRHRGHARDRRLAGALRGGPGPPRALRARVARPAHRPPARGRVHRGPGHRGRRGRRSPAREARRGRAGGRQRDGRRRDPRRVRADRRGTPRDPRGR